MTSDQTLNMKITRLAAAAECWIAYSNVAHKRFSVFHENCAKRRKRIKTAEEKRKNHKLQRGDKNHSIFHRNYASFFLCFRFVCEISWDGKFMINNEHRKKPFTSPVDIVCEATQREHIQITFFNSPISPIAPFSLVILQRVEHFLQTAEQQWFCVFDVDHRQKCERDRRLLCIWFWTQPSRRRYRTKSESIFCCPHNERAPYINWNDSTLYNP